MTDSLLLSKLTHVKFREIQITKFAFAVLIKRSIAFNPLFLTYRLGNRKPLSWIRRRTFFHWINAIHIIFIALLKKFSCYPK